MNSTLTDNILKNDLFRVLKEAGASLMGIGDMSPFVSDEMNIGVSVAIPVTDKITKDLLTAPTEEYIRAYYDLNDKLNEIVTRGAEYLCSLGYHAVPLTTDVVKSDSENRTLIPHKTFATRAGLGWIGKSCLLVTEELGSAIRISSLLTDAPLPCAEPILESKCGDCTICVDACPVQVLKNKLWSTGVSREEIMDQNGCDQALGSITKRATGIDDEMCGKCFAVCPYTVRRLEQNSL